MFRSLYLCTVLAFAFCAAPHLATADDGHVAVISIDGLGAGEFFSQPSCLAQAPTIRRLAREGAYSRGVTGVLPTITYPSHATIVTGVDPTRHGVIDNGVRGQWFRDRSIIAGETLWDAARKAGLSVAIVTWPSTYGADADHLVPEDLSNFVVATEEIRKGSTPGLFDELVASQGAPKLMPFAHAEAGTPLDEMTARFAAEVVRRHKPRVLFTHFLDYDHRMHAKPFSADACASLKRTDAWIAHLLAAYREAGILEKTTVFIVSDHGFLEVKQFIDVHALLKDAGWDRLFPGKDVRTAFDLKVAGGSVGFYPGELNSPDAAADLAKRLRPMLERAHGTRLRWLTPADARVLGGFPGALFSLCARPGYSFTLFPPSNTKVLVPPGAVSGMHGYCPEEVEMNATFLASGYGVRKAGAFRKMRLVDVGPTIGAFLGVKLPKAIGRDYSERFAVRLRASTM